MKKARLFKLLMAISIPLVFLAGCAVEPIETNAVAYPFMEDQLKAQNLSEATGFYAENTVAYRNASNETTVRIYSAPIEDSENAITQNTDGGYIGDGKFIKKSLPEAWSSKNPICIKDGTNFAEITPAQIGEYNFEQKSFVNMFGQSRDAMIYEDAFGKGTDLNCSVTSFGVNMEIVFPKRPEQNTYQIKLKLPELIPDTGSPDYILFKTALEKSEVRTVLENPLAADKNGKWSYANSVKLVDKDSASGVYTVEYTIDETFISSESTKYPVKVNQSINLYKSKQPDTSAYENTGEEAGHYLSPYMLLGDSTIKGEGWTFVRYETLDLLNIPAEKIISAKYVFRNLFDVSKEVTIGAYAVTNDWCSMNTRWFNRPTYDEQPISQVVVQKAADYSLDITSLFKEMIKNKWREEPKYSIRNSFMIKSDTKDSNIIFSSGDGGLFSPYLEVVLAE